MNAGEATHFSLDAAVAGSSEPSSLLESWGEGASAKQAARRALTIEIDRCGLVDVR